ncbi:MAG: hypothetical protein GY762_08235 [Proteobacteria bacterium]|nr:hypothetical protein [Pseudomonadota bacterium]
MNPTIYLICVVVVGIVLIIIERSKYKGLPIEVWQPGAAWIRAFIYFALCNVIIAGSGTLDKLLSQPIATPEQLANPWWVAYCAFCFVFIFFAYWILWSRMILTFDRKFYVGTGIVFGLIWGFSTGGLLLSFYHLWGYLGMPAWAHYVCAWFTMGIWQWLAQDYFWDVYISPEHDTPRSIMIKTPVCHITNVLICLGFLAIWDNYAIYIATQTFALVASVIFQKFPPPWAKEDFHAPMAKPGFFGLPHGSGYLGEIDPKTGKPPVEAGEPA